MSADVSENIGRIEVIHGCMFSGKSSQLLDRLIAAADDGRSVRAFKHRADNRYASGEIVTHDGRHASAIGVTQASTLLDRVDAGDFVVVDEAQFFSDDLVGVCQALAARGCEVVVAGLDLDSWNLPFGHILALAEVADEVEEDEDESSEATTASR